MTKIAYSERALDDLDRLIDFLVGNEVLATAAIESILDAVRVLERHPFIGRPVRGDLRELVISHGSTGYVAMYRVRRRQEQVEILAIRHQREAGFA